MKIKLSDSTNIEFIQELYTPDDGNGNTNTDTNTNGDIRNSSSKSSFGVECKTKNPPSFTPSPNNIDAFQVAFASNLKCRKIRGGDGGESRRAGLGEDTGRRMLLRNGVWSLVSSFKES